MSDIRFNDIKIGDVIAGRYALQSVINPDNGEAAIFSCDYEGWGCTAKIYYDDCMPEKDILDAQRKVSSTHMIKKMDQTVHNGHLCQIMPNFSNNIMSKPVNDKIILESIIPGVVDALKAVHEAGLVHGYVKPENIFYNQMNDGILLGDFGVAPNHFEKPNENTAMNYIPPEIANGIYDAKADYYSLGITLVQLITGKNFFEGQNKKNMIKTTSTLEFELPPKVNHVLQNIIAGLTVKDYETRWTSAEIERALAGEEVEVVDNFVYTPPDNSYTFCGEKFNDVTALIGAFPSNWGEAVNVINDSAFMEFIENVDESLLAPVKNAISSEENADKSLFKLIYTFYPDLPFCWKNIAAEDVAGFADSMKRAEDKAPYRDALASNALLAYIQFKNGGDDMISNVARLSEDARGDMDNDVIAFKFDYLLNGQYVYMMDGIPFADVRLLISYIQMNVVDLTKICHEFINDPRFFAWLDVLGYGDQVAEWKREIA